MVYFGNTLTPEAYADRLRWTVFAISATAPVSGLVKKMFLAIGPDPPDSIRMAIYEGANLLGQTEIVLTPTGLVTVEAPFPEPVPVEKDKSYYLAWMTSDEVDYYPTIGYAGEGILYSEYYPQSYPDLEFPSTVDWYANVGKPYHCIYGEISPSEPLGGTLYVHILEDFSDLSSLANIAVKGFSDLSSSFFIPISAETDLSSALFIPIERWLDFASIINIRQTGFSDISNLAVLRRSSLTDLGSELVIPWRKYLKGLLEVTGVKSLKGLVNIHEMEGPSYIDLFIEKPYFLSWSLFPKIPLITKRPHIQLKRKLERRT